MPKIICIGNATWDQFFSVTQIPDQATKYFANNYYHTGGGVAATAAVACARLGAEVKMISRIGGDLLGETIKQDLNKEGVDTHYIKQWQDHRSSTAAVYVDSQGERQIMVFRDQTMPTTIDWFDLSQLNQIDCLLSDTSWPEGALTLLAFAREHHIPSVVDIDLGASRVDEFIKLGQHIAFSAPGLRSASQCDDIEKGLRIIQEKTDAYLYVTLGEKGCYWLDNRTLRHTPSFKVNCVDTTGAGDVFHGALCIALADKSSREDAIRFACATAAYKCQKIGGREGIPNKEQVIQFLAENL